MLRTHDKILIFLSYLMKYIWYSPQKSKYPLFITLVDRLHTRILTRSRRLVIGKSGRPSELDSLVIIVLAKDNNCDNLK